MMYKITLYDYNCSPICDGVTYFFTYDIDDFERRWTALDNDEERHERFRRSKAGETVTDWYSDDPELNIVIQDNEHIYYEEDRLAENVTFEATNVYGCGSVFHVKKWDIHFMWISFKGEFFRIASYKAAGVCEENDFLDGSPLRAANCYGNPVLENTKKFDPQGYFDEEKRVYIPDKALPEDFEENCINTICFITNAFFGSEEELIKDHDSFELTGEVMDRLFSDVVGEAG